MRQGGSNVELGNLLTLPVGGGLLYVQPVYVRATANTAAYPLLQKVLVSFGDQIGYADTVKGALDQVFGGNAGQGGGSTAGSTAGNKGDAPVTATVAEALARAKQALSEGQAALTKGDFTAYGKAQDALKQAISDAVRAESNAPKK